LSDLAFYDIPLPSDGAKARLLVPARRVLRKLLLPFFGRQVEILEALREGQSAAARERGALNEADARLSERLDALAGSLDRIEKRIEQMRFLTEPVVALGSDQTAVAHRLALLEDRLNGHVDRALESEGGRDDDASPSIRFPGFDRYDTDARPEAV